jgi:hypothetical protein
VLNSLQVVTTDEYWQPKFIDRTAKGAGLLQKLIALDSFKVYLRPNDPLMINKQLTSQDEIRILLQSMTEQQEE